MKKIFANKTKTKIHFVVCIYLLLIFSLSFAVNNVITKSNFNQSSKATTDNINSNTSITQTLLPQVYWGARTDNLSLLETNAGKGLSIQHNFFDWSNPTNTLNRFPSSFANSSRQHGSIPLITWEPWVAGNGTNQSTYQLSDIYNGNYDSFIKNWALDAKSWGSPFFLRFAHEMNGNWYPWTERTNNNTAGDYVKAWKHVHDIFTLNNVTNATWVWCPNTDNATTYTPLTGLYPGDNYVDWTCADVYSHGSGTFYSTFNKVYGEIKSIAPNKPVLIAELGVVESSTDVNYKANWIKDTIEIQIPTVFTNVKGFVYFDRDKTSTEGYNFCINSSQNSINAFKEAMNIGYYTNNTFTNIITSPIQPITLTTNLTPSPTLVQTSTVKPTSTPASFKNYGDLNQDNKVDISDLSLLAQYWMQNNSEADLNGDNIVNISDLSILATNWLKSF